MSKKIAVFGGGIAGLTAAHELVERGFEVTVYEKNDILGGKARSFLLNGNLNPTMQYAGEHGFRFFLHWYENFHDTLKRIPTKDDKTVYDNLVDVGEIQVDDFTFSFTESHPNPTKPPIAWLKAMLSSQKRHEEEFEQTTWDSYIVSNLRGTESKEMIRFFQNTPKATASVHSTEASVKALAHTLNRFFTNNGLGILNAPTNDALFDHWQNYLSSLGVKFEFETTLVSFNMSDNCINSSSISIRNEQKEIYADYYISAIPHLDLEKVISQKTKDKKFNYLTKLKSGWQAGIVFYLNKNMPFPNGHFALSNSPWNITGISQSNYWSEEARQEYLDKNNIELSLSLIIADWELKGNFIQKPAKECTLEEIVQELIYQLKTYCPKDYKESFENIEKYLVDYTIDPAIHLTGDDSATNETPLFMNVVNHWEERPNAKSKLENLFIAGDFAKTSAYLATMESANESGRRAANEILKINNKDLAQVFTEKHSKTPQIFTPFIKIDEILYDYDKSHILDYLSNEQVEELTNALLPYIDFEGSNLRNIDTLFTSVVDTLKHLLDKLPSLGSDIIQLLVTETNVKEDNTKDELANRVQFWANVSLKLVEHKSKEFPESLSSYVDIDNPIFKPLLHVAKQQGSMNRAKFATALNYWYDVPYDELIHLMETGQVLHNCSLLIDDTMDNTTVRRNDTTAHELFGINQTLCAAYSTYFQVLLSTYVNLGSDCLLHYLEETTRAHIGQSDDVYYRETKLCPTEEKYMDMVGNKTGSFFRVFSMCLASLSKKTISKQLKNDILDFSDFVGKLYQIKDDYMDLMSEEYFIKKGTFASDFEEGKYSFPVIHCVTNFPQYAEKIASLLGKEGITYEEKNELMSYLENSKSLDYTLHKITDLYQKCDILLSSIENESRISNPKMRSWLESFVSDIPNFSYTKKASKVTIQAQTTKKQDVFEINLVASDTINRALRNVICSYHIYFKLHNWTLEQFWECFPLLLTVETMIINVDNINEDKNEKISVLTKEAIKSSKSWQFISKSSFYSPLMDEILDNAIEYFNLEKKWYQSDNQVNNELFTEEFLTKMNHYKSTNFRILHILSQNICGNKPQTTLSIYDNYYLDAQVIEDYVSLRIEEFEQEKDNQEEKYNVFLHAQKLENQVFFEEHKQALYDRLTFAEIQMAANWYQVYISSSNISTNLNDISAKMDLKKVYSIAKEIAFACNLDEDLSEMTLKGKFKWCINKFFEKVITQKMNDVILTRLQKDVILSLSN